MYRFKANHLFTIMACFVIHFIPCSVATPDPLAIANVDGVDSNHAQQIKEAFTRADRHLRNLKHILLDPAEESVKTRQFILEKSFGNIDSSQLLTLQNNVNVLLHLTVKLSSQTTQHASAFAYYRPSEKDIVFTNLFYDLDPFCQALIVIHEASHVMFDSSSDAFRRGIDHVNRRVVWYHLKNFGSPQWPPVAVDSSSPVLYGNEDTDLDKLKRYEGVGGRKLTLVNPDSYASAAYRAAMVIEQKMRVDDPVLHRPYIQAVCHIENHAHGSHTLY